MITDHQPEKSRFPDGFRIMQGRQEYVTYKDRASLRIWYSDTPETYSYHYHSAVEIIVPLKGEVQYTLPEHVYHVQTGEVLIVPPNCAHELSMEVGSARYLYLFEPDAIFNMRDMQLIDPLLHAPIYLNSDPELQDGVRALLLQTADFYERHEPLWNSLCYCYLLQMYVRIGRHFINLGLEEPRREHPVDSEIIDSARLYINQHFNSELSLEDVAAFTGFSKYYFSRVFKQHFGVSFSEYLRSQRISRAEYLLIHTDHTVHEIAVKAGFGSIATFNRVFREDKKCTPTRYREIYRDIN